MKPVNPSLEHHQILQSICQPLQSIGVSFFGYTAVDKDNNAYCLGSNPNYAEEYLSIENAKADLHHHNSEAVNKTDYFFWDVMNLTQENVSLYEMAAAFDHSHTLSITRHEDEISHCYHFSGQVHDEGINRRYLTHMDALHAYIDYFDHCLKTVPEINAVYQCPVYLGARAPSPEIQLINATPETIDQVLELNTGVRFKHFYHHYLNKTERNCIYWLKQGKSAAMIAAINEVSTKTIERYIASIKKKLDCYTMFQLGLKIGSIGLDKFLLAG